MTNEEYLQMRVRALEAELAETKQSLDTIQNSKFWRITKPARATLDFIKSKLHKDYYACAVRGSESSLQILQIGSYEKLNFEEESSPLVSIVIPAFNCFEYTYRCLQSILLNTQDIPYEIILADDCSTDETKNMEEYAPGINVIHNENNLQFVNNCNRAAKEAKGEYILFLNNDVQVQENWLKQLLNVIRREDVGLVGSKLIMPDGSLQEAGGIVWRAADAWNYGRTKAIDDPDCNYLKEADYVSGACIIIKKTLWEDIGGFDTRFAPAYYEDTDLAFEVRARGYKVMYQPLSEVIHFESVSNGKEKNSVHEKQMKVNRTKFYEKWKDVLKEEHFENGNCVFLARDRGAKKKHLLMIDSRVPRFDTNAGERFTYTYLQLFVNQGFQITFIPNDYHPTQPYTTVLQQMGIHVLYGNYYCLNWKQFLKENGKYFTHVFLNRPDESDKYIDTIRKYSDAKIVYFGHDLHFLREKREYEISGNSEHLKQSKHHRKIEFEIMRKADAVYYPSYVEKQIIEEADSTIPVKAIPLYLYEDFEPCSFSAGERKNLMFLGGFNHRPNVDAVMWFAKEILPDVLKAMPELKFYVLGSNPPEQILNLQSENIQIKGYVTDDELKGYYNSCRLAVIPLRYGAGVKGKVIEAMRYGTPVVTTPIGAEGIEDVENAIVIRETAEELAAAIIELYNNEELLADYSRRGSAYVKKVFSFENAVNIIKDEFDL